MPLTVHEKALWVPETMPYGPTHYHRMGSGGYNIRAVWQKRWNYRTKQVEYQERWALFKGRFQVEELETVRTRDACMEMAEEWLQEYGIVQAPLMKKGDTNEEQGTEHR